MEYSIKKALHNKNIIAVVSIFLLCFLITVWVYSDGLHGPLLMDDEVHIVPLIGADLSEGKWADYIFNNSGPLKRPVSMATFLLNVWFDSEDIYLWKFTNLIIHLLTSIIIFLFSYYLFLATNSTGNKTAKIFAMIPAIIWLVHPLHLSTVLYLVQRMSQLAAFFVFSALASYTCGRLRQISGGKGGILIILSFALFMPLGAFSKENALLFPLFAFLLEIIIFKFRIRKNGILIDYPLLRHFLVIPIGVAFIIILFNIQGLIFQYYSNREFTVDQRLLTQFRVLLRYLSQILIPMNSNMGFIYDDIIISRGWLTPPSTLISFLVICGLVFFAWVQRHKTPLLSFGILFYFAAHLMESTVMPLEMMFEHRNYIPAFGIFLAFTVLFKKVSLNASLKIALMIILVIILSFQTRHRAEIWSSTPKLFDHLTRLHPQSLRIASAHATILAKNGYYDEARKRLSGFNSEGARLQLTNIDCYEKGKIPDERLVFLQNSIEGALDTYAVSELLILARSGIDSSCIFSKDKFIEFTNKILTLPFAGDFDRHKLYVYKARYLWDLNKYDEALETLKQSLIIAENDPIPMLIAAQWYAELGNTDLARIYFNSAKDISGDEDKRYDLVFESVRNLIESKELMIHEKERDLESDEN